MPTAAIRQCASFGCGNPADSCQAHGKKAKQGAYDDRRGNPADRGYGWRWVKHREAYLQMLSALLISPICGARLPGARTTTDSECAAEGRIVLGRTADHIIPVTGPDDPSFWDMNALQLLCSRCDAKKRQRESWRR